MELVSLFSEVLIAHVECYVEIDIGNFLPASLWTNEYEMLSFDH